MSIRCRTPGQGFRRLQYQGRAVSHVELVVGESAVEADPLDHEAADEDGAAVSLVEGDGLVQIEARGAVNHHCSRGTGSAPEGRQGSGPFPCGPYLPCEDTLWLWRRLRLHEQYPGICPLQWNTEVQIVSLG